MHQFGWLSERGGNFFNLLQKEGGTQKWGGGRGGGSNLGGNYDFFSNKTNLYNMYKMKLHKLQNVYGPHYRCVCCEMNFFFSSFSQITFQVFSMRHVNLWERKKYIEEVLLIHAEQVSLYNFIILREKRDSNTGVFLWNLRNFQEWWWLILKTRN